MTQANPTVAQVAAAEVLYELVVTVTSVNPDTQAEEVATSKSVHTALAAALQQAENEVHGVTGATYSVQCTVPVKQVCSQVMASRNRALYLCLALPGSMIDPQYCELRAPQICKLLDRLTCGEGKCTLTYHPTALYVDFAA